MFDPEKFKYMKDLDGISLKTLQEHYKLYDGYVKKTNEIQQKVKEADKSEANGIYSHIGELKRQETFAVNGMKLHEVYFGHLGNPTEPSGEIVKIVERDFGSMEKWKEEMIATGLSARGWAITAYDLKDKKLHIYGADAQNVGAVWGAVPIIAIDVYEHAYFIDYGTGRKAYLEAFFRNLDWNYASQLLQQVLHRLS